jgi:CRISPR-associated protein Cmr5
MPATNSSPAQPLSLRRARHALAAIDALAAASEDDRGKYLSYAKALPANILRNGLGQAMAMEKAGKKDRGHALLFGSMQTWLCAGWASSPYRAFPDDLMKGIVEGSQRDYVGAQVEAIAYLEWLKKFAVAAFEIGARSLFLHSLAFSTTTGSYSAVWVSVKLRSTTCT